MLFFYLLFRVDWVWESQKASGSTMEYFYISNRGSGLRSDVNSKPLKQTQIKQTLLPYCTFYCLSIVLTNIFQFEVTYFNMIQCFL